MKKISLFIFVSICVLVAGCTSKEQDEKIQAFWFGQFLGLMMKTSAFKQPTAMPLPMSFAKSAADRPVTSGQPPMPPINEPPVSESPVGELAVSNPPVSEPQVNSTPISEPVADPAAAPQPQQSAQPQQAAQPQPAEQPQQAAQPQESAPQSQQPARPQRSARKSPRSAPKPQEPAPIIDVTMDDEALPGKASYDDRVRMKQDWTTVQLNNQAMLKDLQTTFGGDVKDKAFYIMLNTEQKLKQSAYVAANYKAYAARQKGLLQEQDKALTQLMEQNKGNIRHLK